MRKFYIENSIGERLSLSDNRNLWVNKPSGLGIKMSRGYESINPGFFEIVNDEESRGTISGTLCFIAGEPYKSFRDITNWLFSSKALKLVYCPYGTEEYYRDIVVDVIDKSEKKLSRMLECPVTITALTPWYGRFRHSFTFSSDSENDYKRYDYRYAYSYAASSIPNSVDLEIDGHYPGEIELRVEGPFYSLEFTLSDMLTGKIYGRLDMSSVYIGSGESLHYSTRNIDPGIWKITEKNKIDLIDQMEMSAETESFFKVPVNTPVTATITHDGTGDTQAVIDIIKYYRLR